MSIDKSFNDSIGSLNDFFIVKLAFAVSESEKFRHELQYVKTLTSFTLKLNQRGL